MQNRSAKDRILWHLVPCWWDKPIPQTHWISAAYASSPVSRRGELPAQHGAVLIPIHPQLLHHDRSTTGPNETRHPMELGEVPWKSLQQAVQVSDESVLGCYEVGLDTQLVIDAGPKGLGLVLLQCTPGRWQPVACHSRQLTDTEQRYSQITRECMAVRWACEKCYNFLIRSRFTILTDHKPLIPILNNPLSRQPLRIEKWLM